MPACFQLASIFPLHRQRRSTQRAACQLKARWHDKAIEFYAYKILCHPRKLNLPLSFPGYHCQKLIPC